MGHAQCTGGEFYKQNDMAVLKLYLPTGTRATNVYRSPQEQLDIVVTPSDSKTL
jgi:hypothetical protein